MFGFFVLIAFVQIADSIYRIATMSSFIKAFD